MARPVIFFGVNSEGMGHATRSRPVIAALSEHYDVHVFCGGRARKLLSQVFPRVHPVWFVRLRYHENKARLGASLFWGFLEGPWALLSGFIVTVMALFMRPVAVVTDFECLTAWAGMLTLTPVVTLDNQGLVAHGQVPPPAPGMEGAARAMLRAMFFNTPVVARSLVYTYWKPPMRPGTRPGRAEYVPVAVRDVILAARQRARSDGPVLVYQTTATNTALGDTLVAAARRTGLRFRVYGAGTAGPDADGHVQWCAFSEQGFADDLAAAPFVIVNGGHSTISEALSLGKPVLAEPVGDHYEQTLNVVALEQVGAGRGTGKLTADDIVAFARDAGTMAGRAAAVGLPDNQALFTAVRRAIHDVNPRRAVGAAAWADLAGAVPPETGGTHGHPVRDP